jgi:hypothetical protein
MRASRPLLPELAQKHSLGTNKQAIYNRGMRVADSVDFVVVGGGSGGCAVAGRLSEDPGTTVAVLDAGGRNDNWW